MDSLQTRTVTIRTETLNSLFTFSQTPRLPGLSRSTLFPGEPTPMTYRNEHAERTASAGTSQGGAVPIHHVLLRGETRPAALAVMSAWLPYVPRHTSYTSYLVRGISNPALSRITHNSLNEGSQFQCYDDFSETPDFSCRAQKRTSFFRNKRTTLHSIIYVHSLCESIPYSFQPLTHTGRSPPPLFF